MRIHEQSARPALKVPPGPEDHALGPADAPIQFVEYGDYQCAHCIAMHKIVTEILAQYAGRIHFIWRHFPLSKMHPMARPAAQAAEAAGEKFWQMHELLFSQPKNLNKEQILQYARQLGLDIDAFSKAMDSEESYARVRAQMTGGIRSGVNTTPTFYIQGLRYDGDLNRSSLSAAIEAATGTGDNPSNAPA